MRKMILLCVLLSSCALSKLMSQGRSLPTVDGEEEAAGVGGELTITRDERGVPHIRAASEADAAFALGYAQAQDRLFQLDATRRIAFGRLSELVGPEAAELDVFMQGLELRSRAEASLRAIDPDTRFVLAAYAAGVNAGAKTLKGLSLEHRLLKSERWEDWTPTDSIAAIYLFSWTLSMNAPQELTSFQLRDKLDRADVDALYGMHPASPPVEAAWGELRTARTGAFTPAFRSFMDHLMNYASPAASNAYIIGPARSTDGKPILANDPHLTMTVPSSWYVMDAKGGAYSAAGLTVPGLPFPIIGHNGKVAWGVTNAGADYVDFAVVEKKGDHGYVLAGVDKELREVKTEVKIKDEGTRSESVWWTEIGPVVTELDGKHLLVMRWSALEFPDQSAKLLRDLATRDSVKAAWEAPRLDSATALNLMMADTTGDYAWMIVGNVPKRKTHSGRIPYLASKPDTGWDGWIPDLPRERAPARGLLVTANDPPRIAGQLAPNAGQIATEGLLPWRRDRIEALIEATPTHDAKSAAKIAMDRLDTEAQLLLPKLMKGIEPGSVGAKWVFEALKDWDFQSDPDTVAPLVWAELQRQLVHVLLDEKLGTEGVGFYLSSTWPGHSLLDNEGAIAHFSADPNSAIRKAMLNAYDSLIVQYGDDPSMWSWGEAHAVTFQHPFASKVPALSILDAGTFEWGGSSETVSPGGATWADPGWKTRQIASARVVMPLGALDQSTFIVPPGNSGQPASDWYEDMVRTWVRGDSNTLYTSDADVAKHAEETLRLKP